MRSLLLLGLLSCISVACATVTDTPDDGSGGAGNVGGGTDPGTGGDTTGTGGGVFGTGGLGQGGAVTGGSTSTGGTASGGAATGGAATGGGATGGSGTGGTVSLDCEDAVDWVANQHSVNYPPGQLFNYEGAVYRYDGTADMTYVNGDCPPDRSGEPWCQTGDYPYSVVTEC